MNSSAAWVLLVRENQKLGLDEPSSSRPTKNAPDDRCNSREHWFGVVDSMSADTSRSLAYLRAYKNISGEMPIFAEGILLDRGRMPLDKSVMHRLCRDEFVIFDDTQKKAKFILTSKGEDWIAE